MTANSRRSWASKVDGSAVHGMKRTFPIWVFGCIGIACCLFTAGCPRSKPPRPVAKPAEPAAAWTPERITQDPGGYLTFADSEIVRQIAEREARIKQIEASSISVGERADKLKQSIADAANIQKRLKVAIERGDDEQSWPIQFAGQRFERSRATAVLDASNRFVTSRTPLADEYDRALAKIGSTADSIRSDILELGRLREKLALDMERVRLNQGIAEMADLRKSVDTLSAFAVSLADTTDNPLEDLTEKARPLAAEAELEALLKK